LLLLILLILLIPALYLVLVWCAYGPKAGLYLQWFWHHTNQSIIILYMHEDQKKLLKDKIWPNKAEGQNLTSSNEDKI